MQISQSAGLKSSDIFIVMHLYYFIRFTAFSSYTPQRVLLTLIDEPLCERNPEANHFILRTSDHRHNTTERRVPDSILATFSEFIMMYSLSPTVYVTDGSVGTVECTYRIWLLD